MELRAKDQLDQRLSSSNTLLLVAAWIAIVLLATGLRFAKLGSRDFWFDESCTFIYVHNLFNWPAESSLLVESTNLPYYVILRGWTAVFGDSEAAYRALSAVAAVLTIPVLGWLAWRVRGRWAAAGTMLLAAVHPLHVYYAREARAYSLWILALSLLLVLLYQACRRESRRWWIAFGAGLLFCLHLHYFTVFWAAASVAGVSLANDWRVALRRWAVTVAVVGLLFAPYFATAVLPAAAGGGNKWIAGEFQPWLAIPKTLWTFMPAGAYPSHVRGLSLDSPDTFVRQPMWLAVGARIVPALVVALVVLVVARDRPKRSGQAGRDWHRAHLFLGGLTLLPLVLAWLYSLLIRPNYLVSRYDLVAWPAFIVWLGVMLSDVGRARSLIAVLALLAACSVVPLHRLLAADPPPSLHHLRAERLAALAGPADLVIAFSYDRDYLQYYLYRAGFRGEIRSFPSWLAQQVGWVETETDLQKPAAAAQDAAQLADLVSGRIAEGGRVFVLADSIDPAGTGPRGRVNSLLIQALQDAKLYLHPADDRYLILEVTRL